MTLFGPLFVPEQLLAAVSDQAWFEAMIEVESALARAEAAAGVVPAEAAEAIADACRLELYDLGQLLEQGRAVGNPAEPLVRALRQRVGHDAAGYVHRGATSQDVIDSAAMLVSRRALELISRELDRVGAGLAALADEHRSTPMAARTLLQQAVPETFGYKAAGWLVAVLEARRRLGQVRTERLAVQLGGAAGTLAALEGHGPDVLRLLAAELELVEPELPWHTNRTRVAELGGALHMCASVLAKIGLDLVLLAQTEVGEVRERTDGGSSTMPQKRNPVRSVLARACAELVSGYASVLTRSVVQEHERAAGAWHAEWEALSGALAYTGGAAWSIAEAVEGLDVDTLRMEQNLELTGGLIVTERLAVALGGGDAHDVVGDAVLRSAESGRPFEEELRADDRVALSDGELAAALDPRTYLGSAETFVDRALERYEEESGSWK
ncbi:MAG: 3-carboxy-cis,cis-muconate cycloisomerase [Gaiellaceae bacterium]